MSIKIVSDGTPDIVRIVHVPSGLDLTPLLLPSNVTWTLTAGRLTTATITIEMVPVEVEGGFGIDVVRERIAQLEAALAVLSVPRPA